MRQFFITLISTLSFRPITQSQTDTLHKKWHNRSIHYSQKVFKIISILLIAFLQLGLINPQSVLIQSGKWRVIKQVITTEDKKGKSSQEKTKEFALFDYVTFESDSRLTLTSYGTSIPYLFSLKDSILTYWPEKNQAKSTEFRIVKSSKDDLTLKRTEVWGNADDLRITMILHLAHK